MIVSQDCDVDKDHVIKRLSILALILPYYSHHHVTRRHDDADFMARAGDALRTVSLLQGNYLVRHASAVPRSALSAVDTVLKQYDSVDVEEFRRRAFIPEVPLLMTCSLDPEVNNRDTCSSPAATKWFVYHNTPTLGGRRISFNLSRFGDAIVPLEIVSGCAHGRTAETFERIDAPLALLLSHAKDFAERIDNAAAKTRSDEIRMYMAQAQLIDLPPEMAADIATPKLVVQAGKGDIYDTNLWMGVPPTYTPLHKDPNPNLFLQLASEKVVRLYRPEVGLQLFRRVQEKLHSRSSSVFRGVEMMQGPEKIALEDAVWGEGAETNGHEVTVRAGDALFIPKGWWHSIKSVSDVDVTASVSAMPVMRLVRTDNAGGKLVVSMNVDIR